MTKGRGFDQRTGALRAEIGPTRTRPKPSRPSEDLAGGSSMEPRSDCSWSSQEALVRPLKESRVSQSTKNISACIAGVDAPIYRQAEPSFNARASTVISA